MKKLICILFLLAGFSGWAKVTEKEMLALQYTELESVKLTLKKLQKNLIEQQENKAPSGTMIASYANDFKTYCDRPFVVADTGIKKKWFNSVHGILVKLSQIKSDQRLCLLSKNKKNYVLLGKDFNKGMNIFKTTIQKPEKVDKKTLARLRKEARKKRKEIEKKLEAEGLDIPAKKAPKNNESDRRGARQ